MHMKKEVLAAMMASMVDVDLMTCDKLEALTKGYGMLNLAVYSIANVICRRNTERNQAAGFIRKCG